MSSASTKNHEPGTREKWGRSDILALCLVAGGMLLYCSAPLPSLAPRVEEYGQPWGRISMLCDFVLSIVVDPMQWIRHWVGEDGSVAWVERAVMAGILIGILIAAWGWGALPAQRVARDTPLSRLEQTLVACGTGLIGISTWTMLCGAFSLLSIVWIVALPLVVGMLLAAWKAYPLAGQAMRLAHGPPTPKEWLPKNMGLDQLVWAMISLLAAINLAGAMLPPYEFDVLEYHLQAPKEFSLAGQLPFLSHNVYANMPLGSEMFALLAMTLTGDWWWGGIVGKAMQGVYALLAATGVYALTKRLGNQRAAALACLLYLGTPWVIRIAWTGKNENAFAFYLIMTVWAAVAMAKSIARLRELPSDDENIPQRATASKDMAEQAARCMPLAWMLMLSGLFAGAAVAIKYTALLFVVLPLVIFVAILGSGEPGSRRGLLFLRPLSVLFLGIALSAGPWLGKNQVLCGNPVYPLLAETLGGTTRTEAKNDQWREAHRPQGFALKTAARDAINFTGRSERQLPLLIPLALIALVSKPSPQVRLLACYCGWYLVSWWLLTHRLERFWVPLLPIVAVLAGLGWQQISHAVCGRIAAACVGFSIAVTLLLSSYTTSTLGYARFLAPYHQLRNDPIRMPLWRQLLNKTTIDAKAVLAVGDAAVYENTTKTYYNTVFDSWLLHEWLPADATFVQQVAKLRDEFQKRQIEFIYVHWGELSRYRATYDRTAQRSKFITPELFDQFEEAGLIVEVNQQLGGADVDLFRVVNAPSP